MWAALADPKVLTVVLSALGAAAVWLWGKIADARKKRQKDIDDLQARVAACETDRALLRRDVGELRGSVRTLTDLLKKEAKIG